jgi:hypothetical protein
MTKDQLESYRVVAEDAQYNTNTMMYGEIIETCLDEIERLTDLAYPMLPAIDGSAKAGEIQACTGWMSLEEYKERFSLNLDKDELVNRYVDTYIEGKERDEF